MASNNAPALYLREVYCERVTTSDGDESSRCYGESDMFEPFTSDTGRLFRSLQREYGRCDGKVYHDTAEGTAAIGWVFVKRVEYTDARHLPTDRRTYLREVWVTLYESCQHGDARELVSVRGSERIETGRAYHVIGKG